MKDNQCIDRGISSTMASSAAGFRQAKPSYEFIGVGRSTFFALQKPGTDQFDETFPKPYTLSGRLKVWSVAELSAWVESRAVSSKGRV